MANVYTSLLEVPFRPRNGRFYNGDFQSVIKINSQVQPILQDIYKTKHGFLKLDDNTISFDDETKEFSITLIPQEQPDGSFTESFETWQYGTKLMKITETIEVAVVDDVISDWHIGYDSNGVLEAKQTAWNTFLDVPICTLHWNGTTAVLSDERRPILATWDKMISRLWKLDESKVLVYPYVLDDNDHLKALVNLQTELIGIGKRNLRKGMIESDQYGLGVLIEKLWELKNTAQGSTTFDALIDIDGLLLRYIGPFKLSNNNASIKLLNDKSVEIKDKAVTPALQITTSPGVDKIPISDADGNIPLGALKKSMVEACLTGNIESHTHDQYLESSDLSNVVVNDGATSKVATIKVMTDAAYTALGSKDLTTLYVIVG